ncbi:MAG: MucBP domain-containing protein [Erysipelotrichales bacterium]
MKKILGMFFSLGLFFSLAFGVNAQEKSYVETIIPDKALQINILEAMHDIDANITELNQISEEIFVRDLYNVKINESVKSLEGLQYAIGLESIEVDGFYTKALEDISFEPLKDLPNEISFDVLNENNFLLKDGDITGLINHVLEYPNITILAEELSVGRVMHISEDNYKQFKLKFSDYYKPYLDSEPYKFEDLNGDEEMEFYFFDEDTNQSVYLTYKFEYDKATDIITLTLDEDSDLDPIPSFDVIRKNTQKLLFADQTVHINDENFLDKVGDNDRIGLEEFNFSLALQSDSIVEKGKVIVNHIDIDNNVLASQETKTGNVGTTYTTSQATINGYELDVMPKNANGTYVAGETVVNYIYKKKTVEQQAKVIVRYVDQNNKSIAKSDVIYGKVGTTYGTKAKSIKGYKFVKVEGQAAGKFAKEPIEVGYIYKKDSKDKDKGKIGKTGNEYFAIASILGVISIVSFGFNRKYN